MARINQRGDEFIGHGRTNAERQDALSEEEEKQLIAEATQSIKRYTGIQPECQAFSGVALSTAPLWFLIHASFGRQLCVSPQAGQVSGM